MKVERAYIIRKNTDCKILIIPKVLSKAALISVSEDLIKEINSLIYGFIWKGNDKIKRSALLMIWRMLEFGC